MMQAISVNPLSAARTERAARPPEMLHSNQRATCSAASWIRRLILAEVGFPCQTTLLVSLIV